MSSKALGIANSLASLFGSGPRQGGSTKQAVSQEQMPMVGEMARKADPNKRKLASESLAKALKK